MTIIAKTRPRTLTVPVLRLPHAEGLPLPAYQTEGSAGLDLTAALPAEKPVRLRPGQRTLIPTGLQIALPAGHEAQVRPRSGLALKQGLTVLNSPGTIDSDYRGEVQVILINLSRETAVIRRGDRIAQMVIAPVTQARLSPSVTLGGTARGAGGFGSTGRLVVKSTPARKLAKLTKKASAKRAAGAAKPPSRRGMKAATSAKRAAAATPVRAVKKSSKVAPTAVRGKAIASGSAKRGRRTR